MDADTGAILAWATVPGYDANDYRSVAARGIDQLRDPIVADTYEPGSVLKSLTATAALVARGRDAEDPRHRQRRAAVRGCDGAGTRTTAASAGSRSRRRSRTRATSRPPGSRRSSARPSRARRSRLYDDVAPPRDRRPDRRRPRERGGRHRARPGRPWRGRPSTSRTARSARASTSRSCSSRARSPRWSTAATSSRRTCRSRVDAELREPRAGPRAARRAPDPRDPRVRDRGVPHYARGTLIPGYQVGGKTGTAQIWDTVRERYKKKRLQLQLRRLRRVATTRRSSSRCASRTRVRRSTVRASSSSTITSYELFRRIAKVAIRRARVSRARRTRASGYPIPRQRGRPGAHRAPLPAPAQRARASDPTEAGRRERPLGSSGRAIDERAAGTRGRR